MRFSGHRAQITRPEYTGLWSLGGRNIPLLSRRGTGVAASRWGHPGTAFNRPSEASVIMILYS